MPLSKQQLETLHRIRKKRAAQKPGAPLVGDDMGALLVIIDTLRAEIEELKWKLGGNND